MLLLAGPKHPLGEMCRWQRAEHVVVALVDCAGACSSLLRREVQRFDDNGKLPSFRVARELRDDATDFLFALGVWAALESPGHQAVLVAQAVSVRLDDAPRHAAGVKVEAHDTAFQAARGVWLEPGGDVDTGLHAPSPGSG